MIPLRIWGVSIISAEHPHSLSLFVFITSQFALTDSPTAGAITGRPKQRFRLVLISLAQIQRCLQVWADKNIQSTSSKSTKDFFVKGSFVFSVNQLCCHVCSVSALIKRRSAVEITPGNACRLGGPPLPSDAITLIVCPPPLPSPLLGGLQLFPHQGKLAELCCCSCRVGVTLSFLLF